MNKDVFDIKAMSEFGEFLKKAVKYEKGSDIYSELVKELMLKSYCAN
ncbi:MAG: hypothetical protein SPL73_03385 [Cyanobacteriota bacterium]|nr:hypothetical protein [Cyanobacteriota bacterium]MDY6359352.1 hypothetical protein [Cyanobacteriota bacterium]MDY6363914.1 hypothetical protein [Cyanobacteriota bacterium]MDY6383317.1 hypothetical protein [Cyanobacteriota bacterium]